ncbi:MAG TPA: DNA gyrase C-terminal beta-propeller domain-containing protein, partial [Candidatus Binatia bacterium]|nr:DNA gyrase C-terminal beta-propeller domain-containing protein [Candidatus Binatia bacterium]
DMVVTVSHEGYVKRSPAALYRTQKRGGRGRTSAKTRGEDFVEHVFLASTHSYLLFFTNRGRVYWKKVHELPQGSPTTRGKAIVNLLSLDPGEKVSAFLPVREFAEGRFVLFATARGIVKKTGLAEYSRPRPSGIIAINLDSEDELIAVRVTDGEQQVALSTRNGMLVRFAESEVRPMGRAAGGVKGVNLDADDRVVALDVVRPEAMLLTVSANGYGKRSLVDEYRLVHRGAKGVLTMNCTEKTGPVVGVLQVDEQVEDVMIVTSGGKLIRIPVAEIRVTGRNAQGVRLVNLAEEGDTVASVAPVVDAEGGDGEIRVDEAE